MEQFGKYQLVRRIGSGGMAEVFLARTAVAQGLAKTLVIKKIHPAYARSRQFMAMFVDEAKIALGLNHPNIVQVFDFGTVGDTFFLAMENVEGMDVLRLLQQVTAQKRRIPVGLAAYLVQQVAKGLDYAHRKTDEFGEALAIVHRDVSPQNVLVSWDGSVKIVDFGIARARHVQEEEGVIKGKFAYMSPEQARGEPVDCRSDVFSAGIVLFELVCGRPLFPGKGKEVLEVVRAGVIPRPRSLVPDVPEALEQVILRALAFHRDDRHQTARDLQNELGRFQMQWMQQSGELIDSGALAAYLAQVIPAERRRASGLPPSLREGERREGERREGRDPGASGSSASGLRSIAELDGRDVSSVPRPLDLDADLDRDAGRDKPRPEVRERKHVYVLEGYVRGRLLLERRLGSDAARRLIADFLQVARDVAYKLEAHVHAVDDDGFTFVVGLPMAGEDDVGRVLRLGLALVDALDGVGGDIEPELRLAVGVQRGVAVVARAGSRGKAAYELESAATAIAGKMSRQASGAEILVGGPVFRVARADWSFEALPSIDLSAEPGPTGTSGGLASPGGAVDDETEPGVRRAKVYRLRGPKERVQRMRERSRSDGALIGRDLELKALRDAYRDCVVSRKKRLIGVIGETGLGKRALVSAFLDGIPRGEAMVLRTAARVSNAYTPFSLIADLGRDLLGLAEGAEPHEVQRRLERALPMLYPGAETSPEARAALHAIGVLFGVRPPDGVEPPPGERRQRVLEVMHRVQQRVSSDLPLVVVAEDAHWSDDETMGLFAELLSLKTPRPILGIATSRPEPRTLKVARDSGFELLQLEELDAAGRIRLVTERFEPGQDVSELAEQVTARAGGNPFFIREMLDALLERGVIAIADGEGDGDPDDVPDGRGLLRWVKRDAPIQVPSSVEVLLASRFDTLPPPTKEILMHAAILGRESTAAAVTALLGRPALEGLDELVRRGLMTNQDGRYRFRNDMVMTVAYGLTLEDDRNRLHRLTAERLAEAPWYRGGQDDAVIARHLELAGVAREASERYLRAATHAVDVGGNADAFRQLNRALKLLPAADHEQRFAARKLREEILRRLARRPQQLRELHNLRKEAEAIGEPGKLALAHARLAQFYIDVGKAPAASRAVAPALQFARDAGDRLAEAEALRLRASIARLIGNTEEALRVGEQALALCEESPAGLEQRALILNGQGTTLWNIGRLQEAIEAFAEALVIYRALHLPRLEARALNNMGIVFAALGEFEEALAHYKSALKIDQALGDRSGIALKIGNIGQAYADLGDGDRAEAYLSRALKLAQQVGDTASTVDAVISLGQVRLTRGEHNAAHELFERGLELATENRERYQEVRALIYLALAQVEGGRPAEGALELARSATELARKMPMSVGLIFGHAVQGLALHRLGRAAEAVASSAEAVRLQLAEDKPEGAEQILWIHARLCEAAGRTAEAADAWRRARAEVSAKASKLRDPALREIYLASRVPAAVMARKLG